MQDLTTSLNTASISLQTIRKRGPVVVKRQSTDEIASLLASIIEEITTSIGGLSGEASAVPELAELLVGLDVVLQELIAAVEALLAGVIALVSAL